MFWFVFSLYAVMFDVDVFQDEENEDFLSISRAMEEIVDDPIDCYWLIKCFVNQFHTKFGDSVPHLVSVPHSLTEKGVELQQADFSLSAILTWGIFCVLSCGSAKEPGALSESGGTSAAEPSEKHRCPAPAALQPVVQTLFCRLSAWI